MTDKMREAFEKWYMTNTFAHVEHLSVFYNDLNCYSTPIANHCWKAWQAAQAEQSAELERLRKDAERYRWLRSPSVGPATVWHVCMEHMDGGLHTLKSDSCLDADIDAAIAAEGEK